MEGTNALIDIKAQDQKKEKKNGRSEEVGITIRARKGGKKCNSRRLARRGSLEGHVLAVNK